MSNRGVSGRGRFSHLIIAAGFALAAGSQASAQYSIEFLPSAVAGGDGFQAGFAVARGISGNGQVIVGSTNRPGGERAVVWRRETGAWTRSFLPMADAPDGLAAGRALTVNWDGSTIVGATGGRLNWPSPGSGVFATGTMPGVPAIWRQANTATPTLEMPIALGSGVRGVATGVSAVTSIVCRSRKLATFATSSALAGRAIHRWSEGVPRLINHLCDKALMSAYVRQDRKIKLGDARRARQDVGALL
jgi:uncharacterized membrane protein